jgi:hypothetical protein
VSVGERDFRVPLNNTLEYWSVLQRQQSESRLLVFPDESGIRSFAGLSAYQWMALAMVVAGSVTIALRTLYQPPSWNRWREAARRA